MSEQGGLPVATVVSTPDRPTQSRSVGYLYLVCEAGTALALVFGLAYFAFFQTDLLTVGALVVVGLLWGAYTVNAWIYAPREVEFQDELERQAARHLVELDGARYLPAGASSALVTELAQQERWALPGWLSTGQGVLVSVGLVGTFLGLTLGLLDSVEHLQGSPDEMKVGMEALLGGAKLAFVKSIAGVACGMIWALRYRQLEVTHGWWLDEQRDWLESQHPLISDQALMVKLAEGRHESNERLVRGLAGWLERIDQKSEARHQAIERYLVRAGDILAKTLEADEAERASATQSQLALTRHVSVALEQLRDALGARIDQGATSVRQGVDGLHELVENVSNSLPENIGDQTRGLLAPSLDQISAVLRELASTGGQAIGDTLQESVGKEVTGLQQSLANLAQMLQSLGPRVNAELEHAEEAIQQGAAAAASALSEAGRLTSQDMRSAAAELSGGAGEMKAMTESIRAALQETQQIAGALRGAGEEVGAGLRSVSEPLVRLPVALDGAHAALTLAQQGFSDGTVASAAQTERLKQLIESTERATGLQRDAIAEGEALFAAVEQLRAACADTAASFASSAAGQEHASAEAAKQLVETVATFQRTMEETQRAVQVASQSTFEGAQQVTLQAARQVAEALGRGAVTIEGSLLRLADFSETMERSLAGAKDTAEALEGHAARFKVGVAKLNEPLDGIVSALDQVAPEVRNATSAMHSERQALGTLGQQLAAQASVLKGSSESLAQRTAEYKQMQTLLSSEWATHVRGVEGLLAKIKESWEDSAKAADSGIQQNAAQLATYAQSVEKALRLPQNLRKLDETLEQLSDVLDDLGRAVARS
jgi:hypothetical protein